MLQFDTWRAPSTASPFLTVVSHSHRDHVPKHAGQMVIHKYWADRPNIRGKKPIIADGQPLVFSLGRRKKIAVRALTPGDISRMINQDVRNLHATWWLIKEGNDTTLFVGDFNAGEPEIARELLDSLAAQGIQISRIAIPAYGGVNGHNTGNSAQLSGEVEELAAFARARGIKVTALPHPVAPSWADEVWIRTQ